VVGAASACGAGSTEPATVPTCDGVEVLVAASDYSSSVVCGAPGCEVGPRTSSPDLGHDPALAVSNGRAFYIARDEARVFELDPACGTPLRRFSVQDEASKVPSNPQDLAASPDDGSLFVTLFNVPRIAVLRDGAAVGPGIDLSGYDPDGNPQANSIRIVRVDGTPKAFVTLQRLDDHSTPVFRSTRTSLMLRIDVATRKVEASVELAGRNPFNVMAELNGALYLAEPGNFDRADEAQAGIERFDTATSTTRLLVAERDLGGSVAEVAVTDGCGAAIVAGPSDVNPTSLVTFDPKSGAVLGGTEARVMGPTPGFDLEALTWRGDLLYVGDRRQGSSGFRVHVFQRDRGGCALHELPNRGFDLPQRPVALRPATAH
jgi:hypothetical protein